MTIADYGIQDDIPEENIEDEEDDLDVEMEAAGGEEPRLANVCVYCGCDLDGGSIVGSCEHVSVRERDAAWRKKWAAAIDQSGANALRAGRAEDEATSLRQQLAAAREDGERLDWMQEHYAEIGWLVPNSDPAVCEVWETHEGVRVIASWAASGDGPDLRSAIDAARSEPSGEARPTRTRRTKTSA